MTPQEQTVLLDVYLPVFLQKSAMAGYPLEDAESINEALETTALLKMAMAGQTQNVIKQANASLKEALGVENIQTGIANAQAAQATAAQLAQNEDVRNAVLAA
jgi:hypothetical protein